MTQPEPGHLTVARADEHRGDDLLSLINKHVGTSVGGLYARKP